MRILFHTTFQEVQCLRTKVRHLVGIPLKVVLLYKLLHLIEVFSIKWHLSGKKNKYDNCCTPNVDFCVICSLEQDLRSHVARASQALRQETFILGKRLCESEIYQL